MRFVGGVAVAAVPEVAEDSTGGPQE
jgi:hypothetical protein